jgi:hypothetical protein
MRYFRVGDYSFPLCAAVAVHQQITKKLQVLIMHLLMILFLGREVTMACLARGQTK